MTARVGRRATADLVAARSAGYGTMVGMSIVKIKESVKVRT